MTAADFVTFLFIAGGVRCSEWIMHLPPAPAELCPAERMIELETVILRARVTPKPAVS